MNIRSYSEVITIPTFEGRFEYLKLGGKVGEDTFGSHRYLNQTFYRSGEWKRFRREVILRDMGCDLAIEDREISGIIIVHHINPISIEDIINRRLGRLLDLDNAIATSVMTHKAIHYGDESLLIKDPIERTKFDTCPWRH